MSFSPGNVDIQISTQTMGCTGPLLVKLPNVIQPCKKELTGKQANHGGYWASTSEAARMSFSPANRNSQTSRQAIHIDRSTCCAQACSTKKLSLSHRGGHAVHKHAEGGPPGQLPSSCASASEAAKMSFSPAMRTSDKQGSHETYTGERCCTQACRAQPIRPAAFTGHGIYTGAVVLCAVNSTLTSRVQLTK